MSERPEVLQECIPQMRPDERPIANSSAESKISRKKRGRIDRDAIYA